MTDVSVVSADRLPTGVDEVDRVLGGGLTAGSVTLIGGEPGVGKSTLLLQLLAGPAAAGRTVLYVSAEESTAQVRHRAERLGALHPNLLLAAETNLAHVVSHLEELRPAVAVVDSIQTVADDQISSAPGSVAQVRGAAQELVAVAHRLGIAVVLVGHVTKDGGLAGPRVLEHLVDTVLAFEGDRHHSLRLLRATKHRYGSTFEVGLLSMGDRGLDTVTDPSGLFLADRRIDVSGSVVVPTVEGRRPVLVELQALVADSELPQPRRSAQGLDGGRLGMLLAVLGRRLGLGTHRVDVFAMAVGGARVFEPGADLALALAVMSSMADIPVPAHLVACGEVGLAGEIRSVVGIERRLSEAARLGFRSAVVPVSTPPVDVDLHLHRVDTLAAAIAAAGLVGAGPD